jgi:hypothetical protein
MRKTTPGELPCEATAKDSLKGIRVEAKRQPTKRTGKTLKTNE